MTTPALINALTVDVEDYFHVSGFADRIPARDWASLPGRVVENTRRVLNLLDRHQTRATFFILGWVAERHPRLVREIHAAGHEIGCHSYWHRLVYDLTPDELRTDLAHARDILQEITGEPVTLHRAPSFSITRRSLWAFDVLAELGFTVDSSVYPVHHDRYGIPDADPHPHRVVTSCGEVTEYPATAVRWAGLRCGVSGGGYFRLYPLRFTTFCLRHVNRRSGRPFVFYIHPWELDPDQPRLPGSLLSRFRHYQNLATTEHKLNRLLSGFRFGAMSDSLETLPECRVHRLSETLYRAAAGPAVPEPAVC